MWFIFSIVSSWAHSVQTSTPAAEVQSWLDSVVVVLNAGAWCSGSVIDDPSSEEEGDFLVLTAYHCVLSGGKSDLIFRNKQESRAELIAVDVQHDLAVLRPQKVPKSVLPLEVREAEAQQGEPIYALGHPLAPLADRKAFKGTLKWSVSRGIVSAIGAQFTQSDAPLNPGNSGGPVVDQDGAIVGVASRKLRGEGLSFIGSSTKVLALLERPQRASWFGGTVSLGLTNITPVSAQYVSGWGATLTASLRDRWLTRAVIGLPSGELQADDLSRIGSLSMGLSQRIGSKSQTVQLQLLGGAALFQAGDDSLSLLPMVSAGLRASSVGLYAGLIVPSWDPGLLTTTSPTWMMVLDIDVPGVIHIF